MVEFQNRGIRGGRKEGNWEKKLFLGMYREVFQALPNYLVLVVNALCAGTCISGIRMGYSRFFLIS